MFVLPLTSSFHFHWIPTLLYAAHKRAFIACFSSLAGVVDGPTHDGMILVVMWLQEVSSTMIPAPQPKLSELSSAYCTARARVHTVHSRVWRWNSRPTVGAVPLADGAVLPTVLQLSSTLLFDSSLHSPTASCFTTKHEGILCIFACCRTAEWRKLEKATDYQQIWSFLSRTGISVVLLITQSW